MRSLPAPDLAFPSVPVGQQEPPWSLRMLLYRGGAKANRRRVDEMMASGQFGSPIHARSALLLKIHEHLLSAVIAGGSKGSLTHDVRALRTFYAFADGHELDPTEENAERVFIQWIEFERIRKPHNPKEEGYIYTRGSRVALALANALDLRSAKPLLRAARLRHVKRGKRVLGTQADKQNLADTFTFGHALLDITDSLTKKAIEGPLPIVISFRTGQQSNEWCGLAPPERLRTLDPTKYTANTIRRTTELRKHWNTPSLRTRFPAINLRLEAELMIFVAQTTMNLEQATQMRMGNFRFQSYNDGYTVRRYKGRRGGDVEFEMFSKYRAVFERYLRWRKVMFTEDPEGALFPFVPQPGRGARQQFYCIRLKTLMRGLGIPFVCARRLRKTHVNWLLRRSDNPELTAEQAQHSKQSLLRLYEEPHYQRAVVEATQFWQRTDPFIMPPGPGLCVEALAEALPETPAGAPQPDCRTASGCLFCVHHRDVDSFDYVWSLVSYRHLKSLELALYRRKEREHASTPALLVIERITEKLSAFRADSLARATWVEEAQARVDEGDYHMNWNGFIQLVEVSL